MYYSCVYIIYIYIYKYVYIYLYIIERDILHIQYAQTHMHIHIDKHLHAHTIAHTWRPVADEVLAGLVDHAARQEVEGLAARVFKRGAGTAA